MDNQPWSDGMGDGYPQLMPGLDLSQHRAAGPAARQAFIHLQLELGVWLDRLVT